MSLSLCTLAEQTLERKNGKKETTNLGEEWCFPPLYSPAILKLQQTITAASIGASAASVCTWTARSRSWSRGTNTMQQLCSMYLHLLHRCIRSTPMFDLQVLPILKHTGSTLSCTSCTALHFSAPLQVDRMYLCSDIGRVKLKLHMCECLYMLAVTVPGRRHRVNLACAMAWP